MKFKMGNPSCNCLRRIPIDASGRIQDTTQQLETVPSPASHSQHYDVDSETLFRYVNPLEGRMSTDLQFLEEWIPEKMDPGTVFVLENQAKLGHAQNPYVAVMSCPRCGTMGLITRRQLCACETMICGGESCSAEYQLKGENICYRSPQ
jgi:hypothetical protein